MSGEPPIHCGSFELVEPVGEGGMATVWRARHRRQAFPVALKVIGGPKAHEPAYHDKFRREVQAQARLDHPGIATVFEYGTISTEADEASEGELVAGSPYFALEFADRGALHDQPPIPDWPALRGMLFEILDALAYAHARGVIHRDLKPGNVLYFPSRRRGRFRLSDFGLAHAAGTQIKPSTGDIGDPAAGTPHYMPPEQIHGEWREFGPWTDLYALGCLAFECVHGSLPFEGKNLTTVARKQLDQPPPPIAPRFPVPRGLDPWIRRLMAKNPDDRIRRAADAAFLLGQMPATVDSDSAVGPAPEPEQAGSGETADEEVDGGMTKTRILTRHLWGGKAEGGADDEEIGAYTSTPVRLTTFSAESTRRIFDPISRTDHDGTEAGQVIADLSAQQMAPPLPDDWRYRLPERPSARFVDVGLGLFGVREIPFVDRDAERDRIWSALREVCDGGGMRAVEIAGAAGTGTTRLAEWMARRAHELGGVITMRADHSSHGGPTEGLPAMVESALSAWELDRQETFDRVTDEVDALYQGLEASGGSVDEEARALTEIIYPTPGGVADVDGPRYDFDSPEERFDAIARLVGELAERRPIVMVLDDIQWGPDAIRLVDHLFRCRPELPVLVLTTLQPEWLDRGSEFAETLDTLRERDGYQRIDLDPLAPADQRDLVEQLLPLADGPVDHLVDETGGVPLFAVQVIGEWAARDALEAGEEAFSLASPGVELPLEDLDELWDDRIDRVVEICAEAVGEHDARLSLELAAALGSHVDLEEWRAVCKHAGVEACDELYEQLIRDGLARPRAQGWSFTHTLLVDAIERQAQEAGRWPSHHRHCADTLAYLYVEENARARQRRVDHLLEAGEREHAEAVRQRRQPEVRLEDFPRRLSDAE